MSRRTRSSERSTASTEARASALRSGRRRQATGTPAHGCASPSTRRTARGSSSCTSPGRPPARGSPGARSSRDLAGGSGCRVRRQPRRAPRLAHGGWPARPRPGRLPSIDRRIAGHFWTLYPPARRFRPIFSAFLVISGRSREAAACCRRFNGRQIRSYARRGGGTRLARALADVREAHRDKSLHKRLRQGAADGEVQGALRHRVAVKLIAKLPEGRAAERQVAQVTLKRSQAGDRLTAYAESGTP
jgi:hypothetical protein